MTTILASGLQVNFEKLYQSMLFNNFQLSMKLPNNWLTNELDVSKFLNAKIQNEILKISRSHSQRIKPISTAAQKKLEDENYYGDNHNINVTPEQIIEEENRIETRRILFLKPTRIKFSQLVVYPVFGSGKRGRETKEHGGQALQEAEATITCSAFTGFTEEMMDLQEKERDTFQTLLQEQKNRIREEGWKKAEEKIIAPAAAPGASSIQVPLAGSSKESVAGQIAQSNEQPLPSPPIESGPDWNSAEGVARKDMAENVAKAGLLGQVNILNEPWIRNHECFRKVSTWKMVHRYVSSVALTYVQMFGTEKAAEAVKKRTTPAYVSTDPKELILGPDHRDHHKIQHQLDPQRIDHDVDPAKFISLEEALGTQVITDYAFTDMRHLRIPAQNANYIRDEFRKVLKECVEHYHKHYDNRGISRALPPDNTEFSGERSFPAGVIKTSKGGPQHEVPTFAQEQAGGSSSSSYYHKNPAPTSAAPPNGDAALRDYMVHQSNKNKGNIKNAAAAASMQQQSNMKGGGGKGAKDKQYMIEQYHLALQREREQKKMQTQQIPTNSSMLANQSQDEQAAAMRRPEAMVPPAPGGGIGFPPGYEAAAGPPQPPSSQYILQQQQNYAQIPPGMKQGFIAEEELGTSNGKGSGMKGLYQQQPGAQQQQLQQQFNMHQTEQSFYKGGPPIMNSKATPVHVHPAGSSSFGGGGGKQGGNKNGKDQQTYSKGDYVRMLQEKGYRIQKEGQHQACPPEDEGIQGRLREQEDAEGNSAAMRKSTASTGRKTSASSRAGPSVVDNQEMKQRYLFSNTDEGPIVKQEQATLLEEDAMDREEVELPIEQTRLIPFYDEGGAKINLEQPLLSRRLFEGEHTMQEQNDRRDNNTYNSPAATAGNKEQKKNYQKTTPAHFFSPTKRNQKADRPKYLLTHPFPVIRVMKHRPKIRDSNGKPVMDKRTNQVKLGKEEWFSVDNRRLLCLQRRAVLYEELFDIDCYVTGVEMFDDTHFSEIKKFRTRTNGETIEIGFYKGHGRANVGRDTKNNGGASTDNEQAEKKDERWYWCWEANDWKLHVTEKKEKKIGMHNYMWDHLQARDFVKTYVRKNKSDLPDPGELLKPHIWIDPEAIQCVHLDCGLWEYRVGNESFGPFSNMQMQTWAAQGRLPPSLPCRRKVHEKLRLEAADSTEGGSYSSPERVLGTVDGTGRRKQLASPQLLHEHKTWHPVSSYHGFQASVEYDDPLLCPVDADDQTLQDLQGE
ncbi:unnamed protein product [Amoebophrya sp. A120]|nr:unnamed protein product [Amoebophrya sp. A120]|eukprot:GSA120T00009438001.1